MAINLDLLYKITGLTAEEIEHILINYSETVQQIEQSVNSEESSRIAADTALQEIISTERTERESADVSLQDNITAEMVAREAADTALQDSIDEKADKQTDDGGFAGGNGAMAYGGGAVGNEATVIMGGAVGNGADAHHGGAVGGSAFTWNGGSIGMAAHSYEGGAVGSGTTTSNGFAGGYEAKTLQGNTTIDAIQLGTGTNSNVGTLQIYGNQLLDADGNIPIERLDAVRTQITYDSASGSKTFEFSDMDNCEVRYTGAVSGISFVFPDGVYADDFTCGVVFNSGSTPVSIAYSGTGIINWVGTDCSVVDGLSNFTPSANTHYDIVFYFNGTQFIGLVNGYIPATGNGGA